ncbi:hypothetical protein LOTGIDRAFT_153062 [Lottia gigantea]|uniref:Guanylate cyclase n=1 Tax=Lottia gigantea TaxID=225164 RepID=V4ALG5_LOTGI|nr:hypothetical protein LOTGIDRAFT_153062 [Lottia gigantea]ESO97952.1 hypothetical protein LOTGIDRAFT_153062 [Lottia gigantea]
MGFYLFVFCALCVGATYVTSVTEIKIGTLLISEHHAPYTMERVGPALDVAFDEINSNILNESYKLVQVKVAYDNICNARYATGVASKLYYEEKIVALIGPACSYALDGVARLAGFWNIPIVTGLGDGGMFKNKTDYPTLTRFSYCQCRMRKVFGSVFKQFNWTDIVVIYDVNDGHTDILGNTLKEGLQKGGIFPFMIPYYGKENNNFSSILQEASVHARIIVLIVPGESLRQFLLAAFGLGYTTGDYVFFDVELFSFPGQYWGNHDWRRGDDKDTEAKTAFESLLRVSWQEPSGMGWMNFSCNVKDIALSKYNYSFGDEKVNFFVGSFHDAAVRLGLAINETLSTGGNLSDGYTITRLMWTKTLPGVTGPVIIDNNGDRDTDFAILDMDPIDGNFKVVANYWGANPGYNAVDHRSYHWPGRDTPPPNTPRCGFTGTNPVCKSPDTSEKFIWTIISVFVFIITCLIVGFFVYRRYKWEQDLTNMAWRVQYEDIRFKLLDGVSSRTSMARISDTFCADVVHESSVTLGIYKGRTVAVQKVDKEKIVLTRDVLLELKQVRDLHHENLSSFIGACIEPGHNYVLTEYCNKGSLQDVLGNDTLKLDMMFRLSMLRDIAMGMAFIHKSDLKIHGFLNSSNCLVDGKFVLKITEFGLPTFFRDKRYSQSKENMEMLLWVAPEVLRQAPFMQSTQKSDVYSFGIIMEEMILRSIPFDTYRALLDVQDIVDKVKDDCAPYFRPKVSESQAPKGYIELMKKCWSEIPDERPTYDGIAKQLKELQGDKNISLVEALVLRLEEYASNLENLVAERTTQLIAEKKKSETLLYQILPKPVADQLKQGKSVVPETYDCVTIYFSDIVGFTALSSESSPMEIVNFLNDLYVMFDSVVDYYDAYKVETIGDAYMVVSGLPIRNGEQHAVEISRMSLALLDGIKSFTIRHRPQDMLKLRIGIHSGPCASGVVGLKMPRYCLFGDTVNTTSRMESTGEALKIHISEKTKSILDRMGNFITEYRGSIAMKGKGEQTTYWLVGEKSF